MNLLILFELVLGHNFGDFAFQSDVVAKGKNRHLEAPDYVPVGQKPTPVWFYYLFAHASINGGIVFIVTGNPLLGLAEIFVHGTIDFLKCENVVNSHIDQTLHYLSKIAYSFIV